jgi:ATP-dependent DNA helicase RecQ
MTRDYLEILKEYWGYDAFRGIQKDIIESIGSGKDTLGLMPTGGGKSITFQIPALAQEGICLVISPLIALMKDQVQNLKDRGIKAAGIYSGMSHREIITALENCIFGDYKFLYISPERLSSDLFISKVKAMNVSMIAVDESHCISQWGYDFRPAYLNIAQIRELLPGIPVLALTATATPAVVKDIQEKLHFKEENVFRMSFERENIAYIVRYTDNKPDELIHILESVAGSAIVYTRSRLKTKEIAAMLIKHNITASFYHAGLSNLEKDKRQKEWQSDETRVIVATNAFGMGIDKPDVRLVIHIDTPDSPEAYFQEAGRAGRDGEKAYAVLLYTGHDPVTLKRRITDTFPEKDYIRNVYEHLCYFLQVAMGYGEGRVFEFNIDEFCRVFKHYPVPATAALKILDQCGYIEFIEEQDNASRLIFTVNREELYRMHEFGTEAETLLNLILRSYTGVFVDYAFISEELLARKIHTSRLRIYELLMMLSKRRIIDYIPRKKTPYIIYTRDRDETNRIKIPKAVYEERKVRYEERINSMIQYMTSDTVCRSRMLLRYFGEKNEHNCNQCDVCISRRKKGLNSDEKEEIAQKIYELLKDTESITPPELAEQLHLPTGKLAEVLHSEMESGKIIIENGKLKVSI